MAAADPDDHSERPGDTDTWFGSLKVSGDFKPATLDGYFTTVQGWLTKDMRFLRRPIKRRRWISDAIRGLAFIAVALGVLLPLPIWTSWSSFSSGLEMGYLAVIIGGLILLFDRTFNISGSWMRLQLAEMQVKQIRYRLDLDWAKRRPLLTEENGPAEGPGLIDLLRAASDASHDIVQAQKTAWTTELTQAVETLRGRLDADRVTLEQLRTRQAEEQARPKTGTLNLSFDKPELIKGPLKVQVNDGEEKAMNDIPTVFPLKDLPAGDQIIGVTADRATGTTKFISREAVKITGGEIKAHVIKVT